MNLPLRRASLLIQHSRYAEAATELRGALAAAPQDADAHALLAVCLAQQEDRDGALVEARAAVGLAPDNAFAHFVLAQVHLVRSETKEAVPAIEEAIRLDPRDPDFRAVLGRARISESRWADALRAAEEGLAVDAEHVECANLRAHALNKLGRREEAGRAIEETLRREPENASTHAHRGWQLLEQGRSADALASFREALRIDPSLDWARAGIVEALKARHRIYRWLLAYFFWMSRLSARARWGILVGGYVLYRVLGAAAGAYPAVAPFLWLLVGVYIGFVVLTWVGDAVFDLLLRLHPFGRLALSRAQVKASNVIGALLGVTLVLVGVYFATGIENALWLALLTGVFLVPVSGWFRCAGPRGRRAIGILIAVEAAAGAVLSVPMMREGEANAWLVLAFLACVVASPWLVNYHLMRGR